MKEAVIELFSEGLFYTGIETVENEYHGNLVKFVQSFPSPFLGHETQSVAVREQDIDKVIEFLQSIKDDKK